MQLPERQWIKLLKIKVCLFSCVLLYHIYKAPLQIDKKDTSSIINYYEKEEKVNISLKLKEYDEDLLYRLANDHIHYRKVKNALIIELYHSDNELVYKLPEYLSKYTYELNVSEFESGGRNGATGQATIVCTTLGQSIEPLFVYKELRPNSNHAYFVLNKPFITIKAYCPGSMILIQKWTWKVDYSEITLIPQEFFHGFVDNVTGVLKEAAQLAHLKACTTNCKEVFFAKDTE